MNDLIRRCQQVFGGRWVGIKFYHDALPAGDLALVKGIRFCEAVTRAYVSPVMLTRDGLDCNGASYIFGWNPAAAREMIRRLHEEARFPLEYAQGVVKGLPVLNGDLKGVGLNVEGNPDVLLSYLQPEQVMKLIRLYEIRFSQRLSVELSSVVAVCGNVAAKAYLTGEPALSFGCNDSRAYGAIPRDRVVVGLPRKVAEILLGGEA